MTFSCLLGPSVTESVLDSTTFTLSPETYEQPNLQKCKCLSGQITHYLDIIKIVRLVFSQNSSLSSFITFSENISFSIPVLASCDDPGKIKNGATIFSGLNINSTVTYTCEEGYELRGKGTLLCMENGKWDLDKLPICKLNNFHIELLMHF